MSQSEKPSLPSDVYNIGERGVSTFSSGCTLLDCVLGGGWALGRVSNIIGDKSTGKSLLAIEACANFAYAYPEGRIIYVETESAFDPAYASTLGLPLDRVEFPNHDISGEDSESASSGLFTVEAIYNHLSATIKDAVSDNPTLYIIDSLDAVSDEAEQDRSISQGSYGMNKQKLMSTLFRKLNGPMSRKNFTLLIVSQVRDAIGVAFGDKTRRSGGRALDFYATHCLWLANMGKIHKTRKKIKRCIGVRIRALCKKNKLAPPFQDCEFPLLFGYGIEDVQAGLDWLASVDRASFIGSTATDLKKLSKSVSKMGAEEYEALRVKVRAGVTEAWKEISDDFAPTRSKYGRS